MSVIFSFALPFTPLVSCPSDDVQLNVTLLCSTGAGRTKLARHTLDSLPQEFMTISEPEEVATEYQDYSQFFLIWDTLDRIAETAAAEPTLSRESKAAWLKGYKVLRSLMLSEIAVLTQSFPLARKQNMLVQAREQLITLLTTDWLLSGSDVDAEVSGSTCTLLRIRGARVIDLSVS